MVRHWRKLGLVLACYAGFAPAQPRGELLYLTYCIGCHTEQVHWREKRLATDWTSLVGEVQRWQANAGLEWRRNDVDAVARYLNELHYRFPSAEK